MLQSALEIWQLSPFVLKILPLSQQGLGRVRVRIALHLRVKLPRSPHRACSEMFKSETTVEKNCDAYRKDFPAPRPHLPKPIESSSPALPPHCPCLCRYSACFPPDALLSVKKPRAAGARRWRIRRPNLPWTREEKYTGIEPTTPTKRLLTDI